MASEIWSQILSGWPSATLSEVKRQSRLLILLLASSHKLKVKPTRRANGPASSRQQIQDNKLYPNCSFDLQ